MITTDPVCPRCGTKVFLAPDAQGAYHCPKCKGWWENPPTGSELRAILRVPRNPAVSIQAFAAEVNHRRAAECKAHALEAAMKAAIEDVRDRVKGLRRTGGHPCDDQADSLEEVADDLLRRFGDACAPDPPKDPERRIHYCFGVDRVLVKTGEHQNDEGDWVEWATADGTKVGFAQKAAWESWPEAPS